MIRGVRALARGLRVLASHRELWPWAALSIAVNFLAFGVAAWVFIANLDALVALASGWIPQLEAHAWYAWLWVGPLRLLAWVVRVLLVLLFAALVYFGFTLVGGVIAGPFLEVLSERVERIERGATPASTAAGVSWARAAWRGAVADFRRLIFFAGCAAAVALLGLVPLLQPVVLLGELVLGALFLALDFTSPVLARRDASWPARRTWLWQHRASLVGFGLGGMATLLVPGLNFLCLPWLMTSGTLLALELGTAEAAPQ